MHFPERRMRRLRRRKKLRGMVRRHHIGIEHLVMPLFVREGKEARRPIKSMPGHYQLSLESLVKEAGEIVDLGIPGILLFGIPGKKDDAGVEATREDGIIPRAVRAVREAYPELVIITDICVCEYMNHGHCGVIKNPDVSPEKREVANDASLDLLARMALVHARAGADIVAPSAMMDGQVGAIRKALDREGHHEVAIMAYAAKYASSFYGPFREAAESRPEFGDRRSYQMDPTGAEEAMEEIRLDLEEGADIVMVKPALAYLDILYRAKEKFGCPLAAYSVSGEFSLVQAAAEKGWLKGKDVAREILLGIVRAGADIIITYWAKDMAEWLKE